MPTLPKGVSMSNCALTDELSLTSRALNTGVSLSPRALTRPRTYTVGLSSSTAFSPSVPCVFMCLYPCYGFIWMTISDVYWCSLACLLNEIVRFFRKITFCPERWRRSVNLKVVIDCGTTVDSHQIQLRGELLVALGGDSINSEMVLWAVGKYYQLKCSCNSINPCDETCQRRIPVTWILPGPRFTIRQEYNLNLLMYWYNLNNNKHVVPLMDHFSCLCVFAVGICSTQYEPDSSWGPYMIAYHVTISP